MISRPKNLKKDKNEKVLRGYLLAQQKAARTVMPDGNLSIEGFEKCCAERKRHPIIFKIEFGSAIMLNDRSSQIVAKLPHNQAKNRTEDIVPNDDNRVVINSPETNSDYINASFCSSLVPGEMYIVTQV